MDTLTTPAYRIISNHVIAERRQKISNGQNALFATQSFHPGEVIADFSAGTIAAEPTYLTVQVGIRKHITLQPEFLQYINHSCTPNVFFNTTAMELVCLHAVQPGDEFTFFYPSTEWEMAQPFVCNCGNQSCIQLINGASHLSVETLSKYKLTDFIRQQVRQKLSL